MRKTVLTFGLIAGGIMSAMMLIVIPFEEQIGYDRAEIVGYTAMVLSFLLVFFGVRSYRDNVLGGTISFGRAFAAGALIVAISSVCYTATWELVYFKIAPGFQAKFLARMVDDAKAKGGTPEAVEKRVAQIERYASMYKNPLTNSAITFLEPLPVGLVIALVTAGIVRRKRRDGEPVLAKAAAAAS